MDGCIETSSARAASRADVWSLFQQLLPRDFFWTALAQAGVRENNRVYHSGVVVWLMICQRLQARGTLRKAVLELLAEMPADFWPYPCKRVEMARRAGGTPLSEESGAFHNGRRKLSLDVVEQSCDHTVEKLMAPAPSQTPQRPAFFFDGTTARTAYSEELVKAYPPTSNQHGESHWPLLRLLVVHDLYTGLAMRPEWGAVNGEEAVSEQALLERAIDRLPAEALVIGDANFGVFSVAYAAQRRGHPVVLRLTAARARHLSGGDLQEGTDRLIEWRPSRDDRRTTPELPADACVRGRLIVSRVQPNNGGEAFLLALFSSMEEPVAEVNEFYGKRWNIEVDLRYLKAELALDQLTCTSVNMVAKEIDVAILAYNLVRAVMRVTAEKAGLQPRAFSFTQVRNVLEAFLPRIMADADERSRQKRYADMMYYLSRCRLRPRRRSSSPRAVWPKPKAYPARH